VVTLKSGTKMGRKYISAPSHPGDRAPAPGLLCLCFIFSHLGQIYKLGKWKHYFKTPLEYLLYKKYYNLTRDYMTKLRSATDSVGSSEPHFTQCRMTNLKKNILFNHLDTSL